MELKAKFNEIKIRQIILMFLISIIMAFITNNLMNPGEESFEFINAYIDILLIMMLTYKLGISKNNIKFLYEDFKEKVNLKEVLSIVATQICFSMGTIFLLIGVIYLLDPNGIKEVLNEADANSNNYIILSYFSIIVLAPIVEELMFRTVIFKRLSKRFNVYGGLVISSIVFGLLHFELGIIGAIIFGTANCILYIKYRNIFIPMLVHFLNNLICSTPQLFLGTSSESVDISKNEVVIFAVCGLILFSIGTFMFIKFLKKNRIFLKEGFN